MAERAVEGPAQLNRAPSDPPRRPRPARPQPHQPSEFPIFQAEMGGVGAGGGVGVQAWVPGPRAFPASQERAPPVAGQGRAGDVAAGLRPPGGSQSAPFFSRTSRPLPRLTPCQVMGRLWWPPPAQLARSYHLSFCSSNSSP